MEEIDLSIVVAMTSERVIGNKGELPWRRGSLPSDIARFRKETIRAGTMIMGYNTYVSIIRAAGKPLQMRRHIVLTTKSISSSQPEVEFVRSPERALEEVSASGGRACVIGGGEIFRIFLSMPQVTTVHITKVHALLPGDTVFPIMAPTAGTYWKCTDICDIGKLNPNDEYETSFETYKRFKM